MAVDLSDLLFGWPEKDTLGTVNESKRLARQVRSLFLPAGGQIAGYLDRVSAHSGSGSKFRNMILSFDNGD